MMQFCLQHYKDICTDAQLHLANLTNPMMRLFHISQCKIQNRNAHISILNGAFWDKEQVHCGICELRQLDIIS